MLPALLIFLTYMLTCYSFAHLLICLAEHITTLSSFLLLSKIQYLKNLYVKQSKESFSISLFLASEDLPAHLRCYKPIIINIYHDTAIHMKDADSQPSTLVQ